MKYSLKRLFLIVTGCAVTLWLLLGVCHVLTDVEFGENQTSVSWLPKSATNVSYYRSYSFTAYEFEISEADFVMWSYWKLSPIDDLVSVPRYCYSKVTVPDFGPIPTEKQLKIQREAYESKTAKVSDGLTFSRRQHNGGGVTVAYDRKLKKAFIFKAPR